MPTHIAFPGFRTGFPFPINRNAESWDGSTYDEFGDRPAASITGKFPVGPGTENPVGLTFKQMVEYTWRVKKWKIGGSAGLTQISNARSYSGSISIPSLDITLPDYLVWNEARMATRWGVQHRRFMNAFGHNVEVGSYGAPAPPWTIADDPDFALWNAGYIFLTFESYSLNRDSPTPVLFLDGLFYPHISFFFIFDWKYEFSPFVGPGPTVSSRFLSRADNATYATGLSISLNGWGDIPLFGGGPFGRLGSGGSGTLLVEPAEWWPYGGKFDPATGART